jgi:hypothetical protein
MNPARLESEFWVAGGGVADLRGRQRIKRLVTV